MKIAIAVLVIGFVLALLIRARSNERTSLPSSENTDDTILELLRSGRKIEAINTTANSMAPASKKPKRRSSGWDRRQETYDAKLETSDS